MQAQHTLPARLHTLATMAALLQRLEQQPMRVSAEQYRAVAGHVVALLAQAEPDDHLHALLSAAPAAAELYENLRYDVAGLCRSPLDAALNAEIAAGSAIAKARNGG